MADKNKSRMVKLVTGRPMEHYPIWAVAAAAAKRQLEESFARIAAADAKRAAANRKEGSHVR